MEIWKSLKGIVENGDNYEISNIGNVRRINKKSTKILKGSIDKDGYRIAKLSQNELKLRYRVHRLVALAFIPNILNKEQVNHINGVRDDNRIENLEWATPKENTQHSINDLGKSRKGENGHSSVLKTNDVLQIRYLYSLGNYTQEKLAEMFNVSRSAIAGITTRRSWKHI